MHGWPKTIGHQVCTHAPILNRYDIYLNTKFNMQDWEMGHRYIGHLGVALVMWYASTPKWMGLLSSEHLLFEKGQILKTFFITFEHFKILQKKFFSHANRAESNVDGH